MLKFRDPRTLSPVLVISRQKVDENSLSIPYRCQDTRALSTSQS